MTLTCPCDTKFAPFLGKTLAAVAPVDYNTPVAFMAGGDCVICMEKMGANKRMICVNGHFTCVNCTVMWLEEKEACPVCRTTDIIHPTVPQMVVTPQEPEPEPVAVVELEPESAAVVELEPEPVAVVEESAESEAESEESVEAEETDDDGSIY